MHVGVAAALADMSGGKMQSPLRQYIGRHATVAGVPAAAWEPAARVPEARRRSRRRPIGRRSPALETAVGQLGPLPPATEAGSLCEDEHGTPITRFSPRRTQEVTGGRRRR